ncbi:hypothetical protein AB7783_00015 [Tardiphaga sp. 172_B4_N1_3]|uniref:hypothetical protein n=1 Tax=Tardiphaga sp. 172_B4_N1_3 TaxID=3240787 RepID=UPI003F8C223D
MFSGFATRFTARMTALVLVASMLTGCAEFNRRGGVVAQAEDVVLFTAQTKSHRLFRSYMLIGVLMAAARQGSHNRTDINAIEGNLKAALAVAFESYQCLYPDAKGAPAAPNWMDKVTKEEVGTVNAIDFVAPRICQFFDEKMARLDYALYRLALSSLFNESANSQLSTIRDKLIGEVPVISASAKAAIFGVKAINQATTIVDDLLNLSFASLGPVVTLLPLYRDALEMNMWVIVDTLTRACWEDRSSQPTILLLADGSTKPAYTLDCQTKAYATYILSNGNGNIGNWRDFVWQMNYSATSIEAFQPHFALVSRHIWRSCLNLIGPDCSKILTDAFNMANDRALIAEVYIDERGVTRRKRSYSVSNPSPVRSVQSPERTIQSPDRGPESTGSVPTPR